MQLSYVLVILGQFGRNVGLMHALCLHMLHIFAWFRSLNLIFLYLFVVVLYLHIFACLLGIQNSLLLFLVFHEASDSLSLMLVLYLQIGK